MKSGTQFRAALRRTLFILVTLVSLDAYADKCDQADLLYTQGSKQLKQNDLDGALKAFKAAVNICPLSNYLLGVSITQMKLEKYCDARQSIDDYLSKCSEEAQHCSEKHKNTARKKRKVADRACSPMPKALEPNTAPEAQRLYQLGVIHFQNDRFEHAAAQFERAVAQASHSLILKRSLAKALDQADQFSQAADAYRAYLAQADNPRDRDQIEQAIKWCELKAQHNWPSVIFKSTPENAKMIFENKNYAPQGKNHRTPIEVKLPPGRHRISFTLDGFEPLEKTVLVSAQTSMTVEVLMQPVRLPQLTDWTEVGGWSAIGIGAVSLGVGAYFHASTFSTADELGSVGPSPRDDGRYSLLNDRFEREQLSSGISYGLGVALVGTGLWILLTDQDSESELTLSYDGVMRSWTF